MSGERNSERRYGLAADLIAVTWAVGMCSVSVIVVTAIAFVGVWTWQAALLGSEGVFAFAVSTFIAQRCVVATLRGGGGDGDVRERDPDRGSP